MFLYSTNTTAAYRINQRFYGSVHYVWCSRFFSADMAPRFSVTPKSSTPRAVYWRYLEAIDDHHDRCIDDNRAGIIRGADAKLAAGVISPVQHKQIVAAVTSYGRHEFAPLLYIISENAVKSQLLSVSPAQAAHPTSEEYIIADLHESQFQVCQLQE